MHTVARRFASISGLIGLSFLAGAAVVFLAARFSLGMLTFLLLALPIGLYAFSALPLAGSKIGRLLKQLRWWHLLWLLVFLSGQTFRIRGVEDIQETPLDLWTVYRVALMGIVALTLLVAFTLGQRPSMRDLFRGLFGWLAAYALVGVISAVWSVYPSWTLYKSVEYLTALVFTASIVGNVRTTAELKTLFDWTWLLYGALLLSVWVGVILWPEEAVNRGVGLLAVQIQGVFPRVAANGVGDLGALLGIISLIRFLISSGKPRQFYMAVFILALGTLVLSQSRSPLTGFLLAVPLTLFLAGKIAPLTLGVLTFPLLLSLTPIGDAFWQFFLRGQSDALFFSLSGRTYYWQSTLEFVRENPVLGYGAYAAGRFLVAREFGSTLSSLHGTWPEVLIGTGILGLIPLLAAVLGAWLLLVRPLRHLAIADDPWGQQLRLEAVGVMTLLSVRSIFTVSFIWHPALTWLLALGYAEFLRRKHANRVCPQLLPTARR